MRKFRYTFMVMALCAGISVSCVNEQLNDNINMPEGNQVVHFGISSPATKTEYGDQNSTTHGWPIYWTEGDNVFIYSPDACNETGHSQTATYAIANISETGNEAELATPENPIYWSTGGAAHRFYAVYPAEGMSIDANGIATFPINFNQTCTITEAISNDQYTAEPDMNANAYMVANTTKTYTESVGLDFRPIMTTLDIVVNGPDTDDVIALTGVTVKFKLANKVSDTQFKYDIVNGAMVDNGSKEEVTIFVGISDARGSEGSQGFIDLEKEQSVKLTVMLPPNAIDASHTANIRVHAQSKNNTGAINKSVTIGDANNTMAASSKKKVNLPVLNPEQGSANAWMTPLDDDIYVSQLSIPGTHDAGTGEGMKWGSIGQTQEITISNQLNIGIRAFDLRPAWANARIITGVSTAEFYIWHGVAITNATLTYVFDSFVSYLDSNPGEFVIVLMRHESEEIALYKDTDKFGTAMATFLSAYSAYTIDFRPDLTVGDCRKKIIIMSRNTYTNGPVGGYITGFPDNCSTLDEGKSPASVYKGANSAVLQVNDYYKFDDQAPKSARIKALMDYSATLHTDPLKVNVWVINHCSGYNSLIGISTTNAYRKNAVSSNQFAFNYLTGTEKAVGSTGIVMMDFAGSRHSQGIGPDYQVNGDLLPQAIIDNNYKFPMAKKPSAGQ